MTIQLERLKSWMGSNDVSPRQLQKSLGFYRFGTFCKILNGTLSITEYFTRSFAAAYGPEATREALGIEYKRGDLGHYARDVWRPGYSAAHIAVANAIKAGELPHPSTLKCHGCEKAAQLYHHESYEIENHLTVVSLCRSCHVRHHNGSRKLVFGVVPTSIGVVRIAIAGA